MDIDQDDEDNRSKSADDYLKIIFTKYHKDPIKYHIYFDETDYPDSLKYLSQYAKSVQPKDWHDIDFTLWETPLARLQITCSCRSGEQLPSCCAHCSTVLWLLYYSISDNENIEQILAMKPKDKKIKIGIVDLVPHDNYIKTRDKLWEKDDNTGYGINICNCQQMTDEPLIKCPCCARHWHPSCLSQDWSDLVQTRIALIWRCPFCDESESYTFRLKHVGGPGGVGDNIAVEE